MVTTNGTREVVTNDPETDGSGRKIMRMPSRGGQQRKTQTPAEVIAAMWSASNDQMRRDWLQVFCSVLASSTESTAAECATVADEAFFEFHARCNPSKYSPE